MNQIIDFNRSLHVAALAINQLRQALIGIVGAESREELEEMEQTIKCCQILPGENGVSEADKTVSLNAIHALLDTM